MNLTTIQKIKTLEPIPDADRIELASFEHVFWKAVVEKGKYKPGDFVVFLAPDAWVPFELAPFLSKGKQPREYKGVKGERVRIVKFKGVASQGLVLPLDILKDVTFNLSKDVNVRDFSEYLGILKWEKPVEISLKGKTEGLFPNFLRKTDEVNLNSNPKLLIEFKNLNNDIYITEKIDGTSATFYFYNGKFGVCSRNWELKEGDNVYWEIARKCQIKEKLEKLNKNIAIQGEIYGERINNNCLKISGIDFAVFNVFDIDEQEYFNFYKLKDLVLQLNLKLVPVIYKGMFKPDWDIIKLQELARGYYYNTKFTREGIVIRNCHLDKKYLSFKVLNDEYKED